MRKSQKCMSLNLNRKQYIKSRPSSDAKTAARFFWRRWTQTLMLYRYYLIISLILYCGIAIAENDTYPKYNDVSKCKIFMDEIETAVGMKKMNQTMEKRKKYAMKVIDNYYHRTEKEIELQSRYRVVTLHIIDVVYSSEKLSDEDKVNLYIQSCNSFLKNKFTDEVIKKALHCKKKAYRYLRYTMNRDKGVPKEKATEWVDKYWLISSHTEKQQKEHDEFKRMITLIYEKPYKTPEDISSSYYINCNQ